MKVFVLFLLSFLLLACGVETDSSSLHGTNSETGDANGTTDTGNSDGDDNNDGSTGSGGTTVVVDGSTSGFSKVDAEFDENACLFNDTYQIIKDSSFDPNAVADSLNGVEIASQFPYSTDLSATETVLYYPTLNAVPLNTLAHIYEDNYTLSFDKAWVTNNPATLYVRVPADNQGFLSCYRYDVSSFSGTSLNKTKVYR